MICRKMSRGDEGGCVCKGQRYKLSEGLVETIDSIVCDIVTIIRMKWVYWRRGYIINELCLVLRFRGNVDKGKAWKSG